MNIFTKKNGHYAKLQLLLRLPLPDDWIGHR